MYILTLFVVINTFITIIITIGMFVALSVFVYRESRRNDTNHDQESLPPRTISAPFNVRRIYSITPEDLAVFPHPHLYRVRSQATVPASKASRTPFTPPADMPTPPKNPAADETP
ncbi:hypothetical protein BS50DRAFT_584896 [Corynespora cassiicola Philippines]|uniref:Uncharacterized protein n=1 Tax=Corynespora cassiicola Philippines TaxID=1448308 RepID=A0A2T2P163_CORCC|nr:hypothetical protein BS50DRAFT_584896 [Corynespora cassiicola Philippines]